MKKRFAWITAGILLLAAFGCRREGIDVPDEALVGRVKPVVSKISPAGILFNDAGFGLKVIAGESFLNDSYCLYIDDRQLAATAQPDYWRQQLNWIIPKELLGELTASASGGSTFCSVRITAIDPSYDISGDFDRYRDYVSEPVVLEIRRGATRFSAPKLLFPQWKHSGEPVIRCQAQGNLYLAWHEQTGGIAQAFFSSSSDLGENWTQVLNVSRSAEMVTEVDLRADDAGHVYMAWQEGYGEATRVFFSRSLNGGATWLLPRRMNAEGARARKPVLDINDRGDVSIAWYQGEYPADLGLRLAVSRDLGKSWETRDFALPKSYYGSEQPVLISGPGGMVDLLSGCYPDSGVTGFYCFHSRDYGGSWQARELATNPVYPFHGYARARSCLGPESQAYVVWGDSSHLGHLAWTGNYFMRRESSGVDWSAIQDFNEICRTNGEKTALSADGDRVDVALAQAGGLFLLRSGDTGRSWALPEFIPGADCFACSGSPDMARHPAGKTFLVYVRSAGPDERSLVLLSFE